MVHLGLNTRNRCIDRIMPGITLTDDELDQLVTNQDEVLGSESTRLRTSAELTAQFPAQSFSSRCPRCRGALSLRDGKYGIFYGCTEYPRCRGTLDANQTTGDLLAPSLPSRRSEPEVVTVRMFSTLLSQEWCDDEVVQKSPRREKPKRVEPRAKTRFDIIDED